MASWTKTIRTKAAWLTSVAAAMSLWMTSVAAPMTQPVSP